MKLVSFVRDGAPSFGAVAGDGIIDLGERTEWSSVREVLAHGALDRLAEVAVGSPDFGLAEVQLEIPVPDAPNILCIGVNYANRNAEYDDGIELPPYPSMFFRTKGSFAGHGGKLIRPPESEQLDYEGEIVLVIGKEGRRIKAENALDHVAGLTIMNEGTIRDWLRHGKFNVTQGKNFESTGAIGPWVVTKDEVDLAKPLRVTTRINDEVRQDDTTESIIFDFGFLLSYISTFMRLQPGDLISTGTPTGAGIWFDPPRFLTPGDVVEVSVSGVGTLANEVADEAA